MENQNNIEQETPKIHSENIKEEFYKWFENRGLLSDLRAYMRQLMVKALEDSKKNGKTIQQRKSSSSPKLQAINLLVVDYLFHEDYLYTVSVFASEAQILDSLPQYSQYVTQTVREQRWDPSSLPRFSQLETEDILDTLRLPPTQRERQEATQVYISGQDSLLTCVVRTLSSSYNQSLVEENFRPSLPEDTVEDPVECSHQLWSQEMENLLLLAGVKLAHIRRMQKKWAQTIEEEKQNSKKEAEEELSAQQAEWLQEAEQRLRAEVLEQMQAEQQLLRDRQSRVELRERGLASLAEQLTAVHDDINQRQSQLLLQSEELRMREARQESEREQLEQRLSRLQIREEHLQLTYTNLREQSVEVHTNEDKNEPLAERVDPTHEKTYPDSQHKPTEALNEEVERVSVHTQTIEPVVMAFTQTVDTTDHEQQTSQANELDPQLVHQLHMDREKINELQEENLELRAHALQQRHRIDELTNRAAGLTSQLEESQIAVAVLSGQDSAVVVAPPPPALPAQNTPAGFVVPTFGFNSPQRIGAGEESLFALRHQQATPRQDSRRRPQRFAFSQNPNLTSEESSPTDEVIQNARSRIQQLEMESAAVQRNFQEFQNRLLTTDSVMFPPLGASRIRNPVLRVRRSDIVPYLRFPNAPYPRVPLINQTSQPSQPPDEHEDSSSDLAGFYQVEGVTNTRRMFTQRNLRQFERWKQFKKKFQRRDVFDQNRRPISVANSTTSSDDDDENRFRNNRRRPELNRLKKSNDTRPVSACKDKSTDSKSKNQTPEKKQNTSLGSHSKKEEITANMQPEKEPSLIDATEKGSKVNIAGPTKSNISEENLSVEQNKLILEVERTEKLIESVKVLLRKQNNNQGSTLSNESLPLESLPKDSPSSTHNKVLQTDNNCSILTVQNVKSTTQKSTITPTPQNNNNGSTANTSITGTKIDKNFIPIEKAISDQSIKESNNVPEERYDLQENRPEPLTIPMLRLVSPGLNMENEDFVVADGIHSIEEAEQENDNGGTSSVTSGSDILRELNSCKTESNNSIISGGWAENSKSSSEFWN